MSDNEFMRISREIGKLRFSDSDLEKLQSLLANLAERLADATPSHHECLDLKTLKLGNQKLGEEMISLKKDFVKIEKERDSLLMENVSLKKSLVDIQQREKFELEKSQSQIKALSAQVGLLEQQLREQDAPWKDLRQVYERSRFSIPCFGKIFQGDGFVSFVQQCAMEDRIRNLMSLVVADIQKDRLAGTVAYELLVTMVASYNRNHQSKLVLIEPHPGDPYDYDKHLKYDSNATERKIKSLLFPGLELPSGKIDKRAVVETE